MKELVILGLAASLTLTSVPASIVYAATNNINTSALSDEQLSSISMLNYVTTLTEEINESKNSAEL